ncbi:phospholipase-like protein, partial [Tanacetum coccineum]
MGKRMTRQDKEEEEDALIDILKTVVEECKTIYKNAQNKAPSSRTSKIQGVSFVTGSEEGDSTETLPCQLPPKELNPKSFTLPYTIGNLKLYAMADVGASVNVMPKSLFEHLKLANLKKTSMVVEMADMTKKAPLEIVENILVKIDKLMFHSDLVVIDMLEGPNETMLLGKPFLATIHAQIDVFRREISLGIGKEKVKFDSHSRVPFKKIYMASFVQESEYFNPLEIETDVFSYDSPACLLFEQSTHPCSDVSIDTVDSSDDMQELKGSQEDEVGSHLLENVVSRWHVCKPICVTVKDYEKDCGKWPTCNPNLSFCSGYDAIYGKEESRMLKQWICFRDHERQIVGGNGMILADFLKVSEAIKCEMFKEWVKENFDFEVDFGKTRDDPYSRRFDVYKEKFDSEIEQLANEYDLRVVIMESLVKKKQKGVILELKRRHLKNIIFCTYTPYPAMKIRRINANSAQEMRNDQFPIRRTLLDPFQILYLKRKLTMEEMVNKFINERRREHDEMEAFIKEFRTTNKLLLKERNNSLCELGFELNIPFTEALAQMPKYAKFLKSLLSNKTRLEEACTITMNERFSAVLLNKLPVKEKDLGSFTVPCDIGNLHIDNALADLGANISLMPYSMYEKLGLGKPKPTRMSLELAD